MSGEAEFEGPPEPPAKTSPPSSLAAADAWRQASSFLALFDFGAKPTTKAGWLIRLGVTFALVILLARNVKSAARTLLTAPPPPPIPREEIEDYRFRLPERTRREIFAELAAAEIAERQRAIGANTWNGHAWSREDDRGYYERALAQRLAKKYRCSLTQVYLVLDEGIRERWEGPNGEPLTPFTPPLNIRSNSW